MSGVSSFLGTASSISALRLGFANLQPISVKETIKKWGMKLTTVRWQYSPKFQENDQISTYSAYLKFLNASTFEKVKLPESVDVMKLSEILERNAIERFEADSELKEVLSKVESDKEKSGRSLLEVTKFLRERFRKTRAHELQSEAEIFTHSNLPFSFFTKLVMSNEAYDGFLSAVQRKVNLYESLWLRRVFNDRSAFARKFEEMKRALNPLMDITEKTYFTEKCLKLLVLGSNCRIRDSEIIVDFLDVKKVDFDQFTSLSEEFDEGLQSYIGTILKMAPDSFEKMPTTDLTRVFSQMLV